ncbi:hypothetical protein [Isoptericola sp. NPDC019482]|uniref:hypothetical protein n=1 Tax=Isoptericola sp. NPDC019482 TaxID=3154688 RepID=UPI003494C9CC
MILVNINRSGAKAVTPEQIKDVARGAWVLSESSEKEYADVLVAVRKNTVVGAWDIAKTKREDDGRATFVLKKKSSEFEDLIGQESPVVWTQGQANPVKLVETTTMQQKSSAVELTREGNRRVQLDGWTLIVYPDDRARISPPGDSRIIVESAFPGPSGANVTVRIDDRKN